MIENIIVCPDCKEIRKPETSNSSWNFYTDVCEKCWNRRNEESILPKKEEIPVDTGAGKVSGEFHHIEFIQYACENGCGNLVSISAKIKDHSNWGIICDRCRNQCQLEVI